MEMLTMFDYPTLLTATGNGSAGREQVNRNQRQPERSGHERCRSWVVFRQPLAEEKCDDRDGRDDRASECDHRIVHEKNHRASKCTGSSGQQLER